jgi:hypothetical protein
MSQIQGRGAVVVATSSVVAGWLKGLGGSGDDAERCARQRAEGGAIVCVQVAGQRGWYPPDIFSVRKWSTEFRD